MRKKSRVIVGPILRNSDSGILKLGTWRGIKRESCPKANQDQNQHHHLSSRPCESQQKQEHVTQSDLCQRIFKGKVGLRGRQRPKKDSEKNQDERAPDRVAEHVSERFPPPFSARDREWKRRAYQKRKSRLDQVMQRASLPIHVLGVEGNQSPHRTVRKGARHLRQTHPFPEHQRHHHPAECIERD